MERNDKETTVTFERHLQTGLAVVLIGFVGWVGVTVNSNATLTARLDERMASVTREVSGLRDQIRQQGLDRFTGNQGRALERRVDVLESRLEKHFDDERKAKP